MLCDPKGAFSTVWMALASLVESIDRPDWEIPDDVTFAVSAVEPVTEAVSDEPDAGKELFVFVDPFSKTV